MKAEWVAQGWLIPCGAMGAVILGSWLVEAKQSVIENMAPILTRLFTPLFTIVLLTFLATMVWTGSPIRVEREVLIGFDLLLVLVVALTLYAASARDPEALPDSFDRLLLLLVASALVVDDETTDVKWAPRMRGFRSDSGPAWPGVARCRDMPGSGRPSRHRHSSQLLPPV